MREDASRRSFQRYPCSGVAEIFQHGKVCGWGTVGEIGRGGCYIETGHPLSASTPVRIRLTIAGLVLEADAAVAWVTPQVGMGMHFEPASPEVENKLAQFVQKVTGEATRAGGSSFAPVPERELELEVNNRKDHRAASAKPAISPEAAYRILARILHRVQQSGALTEKEVLEIVNTNR